MSFIIDEDTENVVEPGTVPAGEYELRIIKAESKNSQKGEPMIAIQLDIPSEPTAKDIYLYVMLPTSSDDEKKKAQKLVNLKRFKTAFNLPQTGPINSDDLDGLMTWAILDEKEDEEYGKSNRIKRFV